jgi:tetratricopeptide (TPR) repeat protein
MSVITDLSHLLQQARQARDNQTHEEAIRLFNQVVAQSALTMVDPLVREMRLEALRENGRLHRLLGNPQAALSSFQQCYLDAASGEQAVDGLVLVANQYNSMGQYDDAMQACREALELTKAINYSAGRASAFQVLGRAYAHLGRTDDAINNMEKALALFEQIRNRTELARTYNWLGIAHMDLWQMDKAIAAFHRALEESDHISDVLRALLLNNLGETYQALFDYDQALDYHQQALELVRQAQVTAPQDDLLRNLGVDLYRLGQIDEGIDYLYQALRLSEATGNQDVRLQSYYSLVHAELTRDRPDIALQHAQTLRLEAEKSKARHFEARALFALGLCYQHLGETVTAEQMWQQALFLAHETRQQNLIWQLHAGLAEIVGIAPLAETHNRIAAEVIDQIVYPLEDKNLREKFLNAPKVKDILAARNF